MCSNTAMSAIVKVFAGKAAVSALKKEAKPSPGVYINTAHLDTLLLDDLRLPHLPERFRNMPLVMQVEEKEQKNDEPAPGWENFVKATFDEIAAQETIDRDTVEWRSQFMKNNPSWTAKDVADKVPVLRRIELRSPRAGLKKERSSR